MSDIIAIDPHSKDHAIRASLQTVPLGQRLLLLTYLLITRLLPTSLILFLVRRASRKTPRRTSTAPGSVSPKIYPSGPRANSTG